MLSWTIYISFFGVALLCVVSSSNLRAIRTTALFTALAACVVAFGGVFQLPAATAAHTIVKIPWVPALGIQYHLAADGISAVLVLLTGIASVAGILFSWNVEHRAKEFFGFYLALIGGVYGVFLSFDLFLLFVFYELAIIPKYFLIAIWGSTNREYGAMKLALYSFVGSAMVLVVMIAAYVISGGTTFDLNQLAQFNFPDNFQLWAFPVTFVGFAILAGLWPFHTWAPTGHVAAPTAASMLLAGVVMKLGAYGALRVAMTLFPKGLEAWREVFALLAVIGIVYGALVALVQKDFKFVIGYSSVSHMGFVLLGLMTLSSLGLSGAVLQMFSHGIIAGLLFAVVGRMVYDRTHTRMLDKLGNMELGKAIPFAAITFVLAGLASMGMPGFSGFIAELQIILGVWGAWKSGPDWLSFPTVAVIAGIGIIVGVAYTLRVIRRGFYPAAEEIEEPSHEEPLEVISAPERIGAALLLGASLMVGLYPGPLLGLIKAGFQTPLMVNLVKAGLL